MGLRDWFRRHGNVFSISTREVGGAPGDEDMLVEEYGERAVEERRGFNAVVGFEGLTPGVPPSQAGLPKPDVSEDEIQDGEPPPDSASR
jgi:hypothetical protein